MPKVQVWQQGSVISFLHMTVGIFLAIHTYVWKTQAIARIIAGVPVPLFKRLHHIANLNLNLLEIGTLP
ncbi:hypothetical protein D3C75_1131590 [compost metagenome]